MPIALIVILAILAAILLLLCLRVRLVITCRDTVTLKLKILFFSFTLFPRRKKPIKPRDFSPKNMKKRERRAEKKAQKAAKKAAKKQGGLSDAHGEGRKLSLKEKLTVVRALVSAIIKKTDRHLTLRAARLHIRVATGDAASTAVLYGAVSASLAYLLTALDRVTDLHTKPRDVSVFADYLSERSSADIKLIFSVRVIHALSMLFSAMLALVRARAARKAKQKTTQSKKGT
ncbi:MAG: DUF2953 domain-containing protein [Clostridia bacterium]|nr:DUF2953 domain-containing protein [Clostridia bacterium]